jgi:hypothetical protein
VQRQNPRFWSFPIVLYAQMRTRLLEPAFEGVIKRHDVRANDCDWNEGSIDNGALNINSITIEPRTPRSVRILTNFQRRSLRLSKLQAPAR